jgi:hypothetical protein
MHVLTYIMNKSVFHPTCGSNFAYEVGVETEVVKIHCHEKRCKQVTCNRGSFPPVSTTTEFAPMNAKGP